MVNGPMRLFVTNRFSALLLAMASALGLATLVGWGGDAVPAVALNVQPSVLLGQSFTFTVSFDNTSDDTTGYGPFIDIAYDATGPDGAVSEPYDGLVVSTSVSYLGNTLPASYVHELTFDDNANGGLGIRHPFAKDNSGNYVYVKTTDFGPVGRFQNGDKLLVVQLPFGSFTPEQPVAVAELTATVSSLADVGSTLAISVRGGFMFGNDPLDNPTIDPTVFGERADSDPYPVLTNLRLRKTYIGPENETATGPNFPRRYRLTVDVAEGQTMENLHVVDLIPNTEQFTGVITATRASGSGSITPVTVPSTSTPGGTLDYNFGTVVGTSSEADVVLEYEFFVPRIDSNGDPVLDAVTGDDRMLCNQAHAYGDWTPMDPRDSQTRVAAEATVSGEWPNQIVTPDEDCEHQLEAQSIAVQKRVAIVNDVPPSGLSPGDTLEYTLEFQVSDYFAFTQVRIDDVISDGQRWDTTFTPTMTVTEHDTTLPALAMNPGNYTVTPNYSDPPAATHLQNWPLDGTTAIQFRISDELVTRGTNPNLVGGGIHSDVTGLEPDDNLQNNPPLPHSGTVGTIKFHTVVQDRYSDNFPSGNPSLNPRDGLDNSAEIYGELLAPADLSTLGTSETDDTGASLATASPQLAKSIYAINGSTSLPNPLSVRPGDTITFRLEMPLVTGDVEVFKLSDFVPLPILDVGDPDADGSSGPAWSKDSSAGSVPPSGQWKYGPTDTFHEGSDLTPAFADPTVTINNSSGNNTIFWDFGTYDDTSNVSRKVDLLFTLTVNDRPFADNLLLMNQARSQERDTGTTISNTDSITPFYLQEPVVTIYKGVIASDQGGGRTLGGVEFAAPGSSTALAPSQTLTTAEQAEAVGAADLTTNPLPDANDRVRYGVVLFNSGRSDAYDVTMTDTIPDVYVRDFADASAFASGVNLIVQRGNGTVLTAGIDYLVTWDNGTKVFTVELVDNYSGTEPGTGALNRGRNNNGDPTMDGSNVVIVSYDLTLVADVPANSVINNTATLTRYAGADGGPNHIPGGLTDDAHVQTPPPAFVKSVTGTEITSTGNGQFQAVIGEKVTYTLTVTVPEGLTPGAQIVDTLDQGLAFVQLLTMTPSTGINVQHNPPIVTILDPGTARQVRFTIGDILNSNTGNSGGDSVTLVFEAIVLNQNTLPSPPGNQAGVTLDNTAQFSYTSGPSLDSSPAQAIEIVEPALSLTKQIAPDNGGVPGSYANTLSGKDAGDTVYYKVTITHTGGPAAFDLGFGDTFSSKLTSLTVYSATSTGTSVGGTPQTLTTSDFSFTGQTLNFVPTDIDLAVGGSIEVVVRATIDLSVLPGEAINNQATVTWTSLDGDFTSPRTGNNSSSTERTGAGGVGSDTDVLNNYAAQNSTSTGVLNAAVPMLYKEIVATSESHTAETRVLVDFTNTGFDGWTPGSDFTGGVNTWQTPGNTTLFPQFIRIGGTATERGGGFFNYSAPNYLDLRGYATIGAMLRANTGNAATPLWIQLTDADGTVFRLALATSPTAGLPGFSQSVSASLLSPTAVVTPGSTTGLDLARIVKLELRGDGGTSAMHMDIDRIYAMRTLAAPGEIVRYRLTAQIPEGTLPDFAISEILPPGLRFINDSSVRVAFVANGAGIASSGAGSGGAAVPGLSGTGLNLTGSGDDVSSFSLAVGGANGLTIGEGTPFDANVSNSRTSDADTYTDGTDVWFRLGTLVNSDNDADAEYVVIEFNALVTNDRDATAGNGSAQQAGVGLSNTFQTRINSSTDNTQVGSTSTANDFQAVVIVEPQINNLSKTITTIPLDAGDPITYQIKFSNNSAHPAQYAPHVRVATTTDIGASFNSAGGTGGTGRFTGAPGSIDGVALADGDRVLVKNQSTASQNGIYKVVDAVNGVWDRATDFDTAAEMNLGYRAYVESGTVNGGKTFALDASVTTINTDPVNFSEVAANPAVAAASTANISNLSSTSRTVDGVTLNEGDRVLLKNQTTGSQNGIYRVTVIDGSTMSLARATDYDASGEVVIGFQVFVVGGTLNGGRTFAMSAGSLGSSQTWTPVDPVTAFDIVLTDPLPSGVLFQSLTITTPDVPAGQTFTASGLFTGGSVTVPSVGSSGTITVNLDALAPESKIAGSVKDVTVVVNGVVVNTSAASTELVNTAKLAFTSLPGSKGTATNPTGTDPTTSGSVDNSGGQYGERNGDGVPSPTDNTAVNYRTTQRNNYSVASTAITTLNSVTVDKSFKDGSLSPDDTSLASTTGANVAIGEQVTYDILVTLPEGTTPDVVLNDVLPAGLRLDSYSVITTTSGSARLVKNFAGSFTLNPPTVAPPLPVAGPETVSFSFGDCTATADGDSDNNSFVVRVTATVLNIPGNQEGVTRANTATVRFDDPAIPDRIVPDNNPANDPVVTVVEPNLTIDKQVDAALVDAGDDVTYTFTISNSGSQAAYNVSLLDAIPAIIQSPVILTGVGDFSATGFYDATVVGATTADLGATFYPTGGSQNKGSFSGAPTTLDTSVTLADNDLVLVKDQTAPEQNGIYLVVHAATGDWERWTDFDENTEMLTGYHVHVAGGNTHAGQVFELISTVNNVNTDPVNWAYYADVTAPTVNDFEISAGTLQVKPSFTLNVPPNASITLKVKGTVANSIAPSQSIPNTASLTWTSMQGSSPDERTGADGPGGALDDYAAKSVVTSTGRDAIFAKTLFNTDQTETSDPNVTIGELVTYALKVTLPEGTTPDLTVTDHIPAGMKYESYMLIFNHAQSGGLLTKDFTGNVPTPDTNGGGASGDDITLTFGAITVAPNNDPDDNAFLILLTVRVLDETGNKGFLPDQTVLQNTATFEISGDGLDPYTTPAVNTPVVEPHMTIAKNIVQTGADAGDTIDIELAVNNTGLLTAYDVIVEDPLNTAKFDPNTVNFGVAGTDYPIGFTPSVNTGTGLITYTGGNLAVGGPYVFKFKVNLTTTVSPGEAVNNTATVAQATTLEGTVPGERNEPPVNANDNVTIYSHGLSGYVYHDPNNNGLKETAESPIGGVTITLTGTDHLGNPVSHSTVTGPDGYYEFTGLRAGTYTITETQPAGWLDGKETSGTPWTGTVDNTPGSQTISAITIPTGTPSTMGQDHNFGELRPASIGNRVWLDENSDGYQDAGEPGIPNVQVNLYDANGNLVTTTLTDLNGGYLFTGLRPGTYYVDVLDGTGGQSYTLPFAGMTQTPPSTLPGADFGNQDHGTTSIPNTSLTGYQVNVGDSGENLTADFGYNYNPAADVNGNTGTAALGDRVWIDADGDGFQDPNEVGLAGVTVNLYTAGPDGIFGTADDVLAASTTTDAAGQYIFTGLAVGAYVVQVVPPVGFMQTGDPDHFGATGTNNDNQTTAPVVLCPGDVFLNADFGYQPPASQNNSVGNYVWLDADADGAQDGTEYGIPGVTVALVADLNSNGAWDMGEPIIGTTVTDASGGYLFAGLPDGKYLVWVNDTDNVLAGKAQTYDSDGLGTPHISAVDLDSTGVNAVPVNNTDQDFGYRPLGQTATAGLIGDRVWLDIDGDGVQDAGEPGLEGVRVELYGPNQLFIGVTYTDENGYYYFGGLPAGTGTVVVIPPAGMTQTYDADGVSTPNQSTVTIATGEINLLQDFGYRGTGTIGNLVWADRDADGLRDASESVIGGVTLDLYWDLNGNGVIDPGEPRVGSTVTTSDGSYQFGGLPTDDGGGNAQYVVVVTDTAGVLDGWWHSLGTPGSDNNSQSDPYAVELTPLAPSNTTADFGYFIEPAGLGNRVWNDSDADGVQDAGEPGIPGVVVTLRIEYEDGTVTVLVTKTDATGYYWFGNLLLDEDYNGIGAGEPKFTVSVNIGQESLAGLIPTLVDNPAAGEETDSDNPAGVEAAVMRGVEADWYDFGFRAIPQTLAILDKIWLEDTSGVAEVVWRTTSEVGTVWYDLYREIAGAGWVLVNSEPVLAENSLTGGKYRVVDEGAVPPGPYRYRLVEVQSDGTERVVGEYEVRFETSGGAGGKVRIDRISIKGRTAEIVWSGGVGPYVLEKRAGFGDGSEWRQVGVFDGGQRRAQVAVDDDTCFFRVRTAGTD